MTNYDIYCYTKLNEWTAVASTVIGKSEISVLKKSSNATINEIYFFQKYCKTFGIPFFKR